MVEGSQNELQYLDRTFLNRVCLNHAPVNMFLRATHCVLEPIEDSIPITQERY